MATKSVPIAEAWIRELHAVICKTQKTFQVVTPLGTQEQDLPIGQYKDQPNHVITASGELHAYAPVLSTPGEMQRLCQELRSELFEAAHPALQAAYAHYGLVAIHPFSDGNGRVARALASIFTYRARSIPLLIIDEQKGEYFAALEAADNGDYQRFVDFMFDRTLDAVQLMVESLRAATLPSIENGIGALKQILVTRGGYTHESIDRAAYTYFDLFQKLLEQRLGEATQGTGISFELQRQLSSPTIPPHWQKPHAGRWQIIDASWQLP